MNEIEAVGAEAILTAAPPRESSADRPERPWIFGFLIGPSAVVANGVIQGGGIAFLLSQQGIQTRRRQLLPGRVDGAGRALRQHPYRAQLSRLARRTRPFRRRAHRSACTLRTCSSRAG